MGLCFFVGSLDQLLGLFLGSNDCLEFGPVYHFLAVAQHVGFAVENREDEWFGH